MICASLRSPNLKLSRHHPPPPPILPVQVANLGGASGTYPRRPRYTLHGGDPSYSDETAGDLVAGRAPRACGTCRCLACICSEWSWPTHACAAPARGSVTWPSTSAPQGSVRTTTVANDAVKQTLTSGQGKQSFRTTMSQPLKDIRQQIARSDNGNLNVVMVRSLRG